MKATILPALAAVVLTAATSSAVQAGDWSARWTGPYGGVYEVSGGCNNGACQNSGTYTGPNGGVWRHSGNAHQVAPGQWAGEGTLVGPGGRTWQNSWAWHGGGN